MSGSRKIVVVGLGYVGLPLAVALARKFEVVGFDVDPERISELRAGYDRTREVPEAELGASTLQLTDPPDNGASVVKPGITGWAQVNQGHGAGVDQALEKLRYDFYYIKYFSPWLDVLIVFRTIKTMLTGWGSR